MILDQWARQWGIDLSAIADLKMRLAVATDPSASEAESEAGVQSRIRLKASERGWRLWRNNNGATYDDEGNFIRYGLANDSSKINKSVKSSDLVGIKPVTITQDMVGKTIGQFVAREVKKPSWRYRGTDAEQAQLAFIQLVVSLGGDARFTNDEHNF